MIQLLQQRPDHRAGLIDRNVMQVAVGVQALQKHGPAGRVGRHESYCATATPVLQGQMLVQCVNVGPGHLQYGAALKRGQCLKANDAQVCDDAAALAQKGLAAPKGADVSDDAWKKLTGATYPIYHSAIALDFASSKQDFKSAIAEYRTELMLYPLPATQIGAGLVDTLQLAEAYSKPGESRDMVQAVWFYARAWNRP